MSLSKSLSYKNISRKPARSIALILLSSLLCFIIAGGSLAVSGLRNGLASLDKRLGADIMVVPYEAATKKSLEGIVLQGNTGYFYMDAEKYEQLKKIEGVGQISAQFFLASVGASCCSTRVQIIGIDPLSDFTIQPWIKHSYSKELENLEILVGSDLNAFTGDILQFYGTQVRVAGKLDKTGTYLDTAVFSNFETIRILIEAAKQKKMFDFGNIDPDNIVSCVLINVADGYSVDEVLLDISHVRKIKAVKTKDMIAGISSSLRSVSDIIGILISAVWILALIIEALAFAMIANERKKEMAILRVLGASSKKLSSILMKEALMISALGSVIGAALALMISAAFNNLISAALELPFLMPDIFSIIIICSAAIVISAAAAVISNIYFSSKAGKIDAAIILRGDN